MHIFTGGSKDPESDQIEAAFYMLQFIVNISIRTYHIENHIPVFTTENPSSLVDGGCASIKTLFQY